MALVFQSRPITSINVTETLIFVSEGSAVLVYDLRNFKLLCCSKIAPVGHAITGFEICESSKGNRFLKVFVYAKRWSNTLLFDCETNEFEKCDLCFSDVVGTRNYIAAKWIAKGTQLATLTDENALDVFDLNDVTNTPGRTSLHVKINSKAGIGTSLFSATIHGDDVTNLVVFAGTNLGQIFVWAPKDNSSDYHLRIDGIKGSVLSLKFVPELRFLIASSDERTVYLWRFSKPLNLNSLREQEIGVELVHELCGHTGRVWDVDASSNYIASAGQDGRCLLWSVNGDLLQEFSRTTVASIRCCRFTEKSDTVIFGSDDGTIQAWSIGIHADIFQLNPGQILDYPRQIQFCHSSKLVFSTYAGNLYMIDVNSHEVQHLLCDEEFVGYNTFSISPCRTFAAIGGKNGAIKFFGLNCEPGKLICKFKLLSKIVSIKWTSSERVIVSSCDAVHLLTLTRTEASNFELSVAATYGLCWKEKPGVPSAAEITIDNEAYMIVSDELGHIYVFPSTNAKNISEPLFVIKKPHGNYGVCDLKLTGTNGLWSVGRNKLIKKWKLVTAPVVNLECVETLSSCMNWNSKLHQYGGGSLVCGFHENDFVIYDLSEDLILQKIPCGGAHRSWDVVFDQIDSVRFKFAFIRNKSIHVSFGTSNVKTLKTGCYGGKTVNVLNVLAQNPELKDKNFYALIGGEDGVLHLLRCEMESGASCNEIAKLTSHISSVRSLASKTLSWSDIFVVSGGGRSQLVLSVIAKPEGNAKALWTERISYLIPSLSEASDVDMRIMEIQLSEVEADGSSCRILCACSDGFYRVLVYKSAPKSTVTLVFVGSLKNSDSEPVHAITRAAPYGTNAACLPQSIISDSAGRIAVVQNIHGGSTMRTEWIYQAAPSCITALAISFANGSTFIASGADDGIVRIHVIKSPSKYINFDDRVVLVHEDRISHCAAVTSVRIFNSKWICACSADQMIVVTSLITLQSVKYRAGIMDVQSVEIIENRKRHFLLVVGQGFEILQVSLEDFR